MPPLPAAPAVPAGVLADAPSLTRLGVTDAGAAAPAARLAVAVTLRYRDQSGLDRLVAEQSDPQSAQFRHWLSNAEFDARFAPSQADYSRVVRSLRSAGFRVDATYPNRTVIDATATVAVIERYFRTRIRRVARPSGGAYYVNAVPAHAPPGLRSSMLAVDGLDTLENVRTDHATVARGAAVARPSSSNAALFGPVSTVTGYRGYAPLALSAGYDLPVRHRNAANKPYDGSGRASAVVIDADFAESDLRGFLAYFHIARTGPATKRVLLKGGPPQGDSTADSVEAALDAEALVGNAPGTALSMYEIPSFTNANITDAYARVVSDNAVDAVNSSFGGCEIDIGAKTVEAWNRIAEQGAAKGITFHASTGDSGGSLCANAPASSPYVVAVGGTALTVGNGGSWASEVGWSGGGGGISTIFAQPAWQRGVAGSVDRGRNAPDVALDANPLTGMAFYYTGTWDTQYNPLGGTSLSSPIFGAAIAEIDQLQNARSGNAANALYRVFKSNGYGSGSAPLFHDIVLGSNGPFDASAGYDLVTGIGSVDFWNTANKL